MHIAFCVAELRNTPHKGDKLLNAYIVIKCFFVPFWSVAKLFLVKHCLLFYTLYGWCVFFLTADKCIKKCTLSYIFYKTCHTVRLRRTAPPPTAEGCMGGKTLLFWASLIVAGETNFCPYRVHWFAMRPEKPIVVRAEPLPKLVRLT